jgi:hypothetical protein
VDEEPEDWGHEDCSVCEAARAAAGPPPAPRDAPQNPFEWAIHDAIVRGRKQEPAWSDMNIMREVLGVLARDWEEDDGPGPGDYSTQPAGMSEELKVAVTTNVAAAAFQRGYREGLEAGGRGDA